LPDCRLRQFIEEFDPSAGVERWASGGLQIPAVRVRGRAYGAAPFFKTHRRRLEEPIVILAALQLQLLHGRMLDHHAFISIG